MYSISDVTFHPWNSLASAVDPESDRKQQTSIETLKVVEWTEEANYHFRLSELPHGS